MTMTCIDTFENEIAERTAKASHDWTHCATFEHEDGSFTFIYTDEFGRDYADPRDCDGNIATLVNTHRDYRDMDEPDDGLHEARERWDWLGTFGYSSRGQRGFPRYGEPTETEHALFLKYDREDMVKRYVAMFRPDILHYEDEWSVSGYTQGDWQNGWGFVTREAWDAAFPSYDPATGYTYTDPRTDELKTITPASAFEQEVDLYQQYFRGDVYSYVHIEKGDPIYEADFTGDTLVGHEYSEDSCGGFLGYESLEDIAAQATDSPVVSES